MLLSDYTPPVGYTFTCRIASVRHACRAGAQQKILSQKKTGDSLVRISSHVHYDDQYSSNEWQL